MSEQDIDADEEDVAKNFKGSIERSFFELERPVTTRDLVPLYHAAISIVDCVQGLMSAIDWGALDDEQKDELRVARKSLSSLVKEVSEGVTATLRGKNDGG